MRLSRFIATLTAFLALVVLSNFANAQDAAFAAPQSVVTGPVQDVGAPVYHQPAYQPSSTCNSPGGCSGGCNGCDLTPRPTVVPNPCLPVKSCCVPTGPLDIPPLWLPPRFDTPPLGRSAGRPLFGKWNGF